MSVVFVLVFAAIIMAGAFLVAFIWSVKNGQYEDTYTPSVRILFDDPVVKSDAEKEKSRSDQSQLTEKKEKESRSDRSQLAEKKEKESRGDQSQSAEKKEKAQAEEQAKEKK